MPRDSPPSRLTLAPSEQERSLAATNALAHLLACLDNAVACLNDCMFDVDAQVVAAHRAQLARGREWPGDSITPVTFNDGSTNAA